jgi:predicted flavoprotein YhiN
MFMRAMTNSRHYAAVGIVEDMEAFARKLGLTGLQHLNKGRNYSAPSHLRQQN